MESKTTRNKKGEKAVNVCLCEFFFVLFARSNRPSSGHSNSVTQAR